MSLSAQDFLFWILLIQSFEGADCINEMVFIRSHLQNHKSKWVLKELSQEKWKSFCLRCWNVYISSWGGLWPFLGNGKKRELNLTDCFACTWNMNEWMNECLYRIDSRFGKLCGEPKRNVILCLLIWSVRLTWEFKNWGIRSVQVSANLKRRNLELFPK